MTSTAIQSRGRWLRPALIVLLVVVLLGMLEGSHIYLGSYFYRGPDASPWIILTNVITWLGLAVLIPPAIWLSSRYPLLSLPDRSGNASTDDRGPRWKAWVIHAMAAMVFAGTHLIANAFIYAVILGREELRYQVVAQLSSFFTLDVLTYGAIAGMHHAFRYHRRAVEKAQENTELRGLLAETQLDALKRQLRPHFLFNTLNALSNLALRGDREAVVESLGRLADLLRTSLDEGLKDRIPLGQELSLLDGYLALQDVRFGDRLDVHLDIQPDTLDVLVPSLFLQPLVENAIEHGTSRVAGQGMIRIQSRRTNGDLEVEVLDNGPGFPATNGRAGREGIGLSNTRRRLDALYGPSAVLEVNGGQGGRVRICMPAQSAEAPAGKGAPA